MCVQFLADADPPTAALVFGSMIFVSVAAVCISLIVCVYLAATSGRRLEIAKARSQEQAIRQRLIAESGMWCPACGTTRTLRPLKEGEARSR